MVIYNFCYCFLALLFAHICTKTFVYLPCAICYMFAPKMMLLLVKSDACATCDPFAPDKYGIMQLRHFVTHLKSPHQRPMINWFFACLVLLWSRHG